MIHGGSMIGEGSYGCVFKPSIPCNKYKSDNNKVSKVFASDEATKELNQEYKINKMIEKIPNHQLWSNIWYKKCKPPDYTTLKTIEPDIDKCLDMNNISINEYNNQRNMLIGDYGGTTFNEYILKLLTKKKFNDINVVIRNILIIFKNMKPLFIGIDQMNKNGILHNDIKGDNIMINNGQFKLIDFGLSSNHTNIKFIIDRSLGEFDYDRIYIPYTYEYIYSFADKDSLNYELDDIKYNIYRYSHETYNYIHEIIFKRNNSHKYLIDLISRIKNKESSNINELINKVDVYSLGIILPLTIFKLSMAYGKKTLFNKLMNHKYIKPIFELFKDMTEPDALDRISSNQALKRYNNLEKEIMENSKLLTMKNKKIRRINTKRRKITKRRITRK